MGAAVFIQPHSFTQHDPNETKRKENMHHYRLSVDAEQTLKRQGDLFGIFLEDISHAVDGGLYGELVQNRSFEYDPVDNAAYMPLTGWQPFAHQYGSQLVHVETRNPLNENNVHYLVIENIRQGIETGIRNRGYNDGINVEFGKGYLFSLYARLHGGHEGNLTLTVRLETPDGSTLAEHAIHVDNREWTRQHIVITPRETCRNASLVLCMTDAGALDLDMISLFPSDDGSTSPNASDAVASPLRGDIARMLADLHPKFVRFPGGCLTHDGSLERADRNAMYRWKNTLGPIEQRPSKRNSWGYNQTLGLGFYEFFQFCEQIGAKPIPVLGLGVNPHNGLTVPLSRFDEWVDDALDLIEFANGGKTSEWGRIRAEMGHPEPFHMEYLALGNEEISDEFFERYEIAANRIHDQHPEITLIGSAGPTPQSDAYVKGYQSADSIGTTIVDEHFYQSPQWMIMNHDRYEHHPYHAKAFIGEYASEGDTWFNALSEAAFMTGLERSGNVALASYAPLLNNVKYTNWSPNLINYDGYRVYGTPSYFVQQLFMANQGDMLVESSSDLPKRTPAGFDPTGTVTLSTANAHVDIQTLTVHANGSDAAWHDLVLDPDGQQTIELTDMAEHSFSMDMTFFTRPADSVPDSNAQDFVIRFAQRDENNFAEIVLDGWGDNVMFLRTVEDGRESYHSLYNIRIDKSRQHDLSFRIEHGDFDVRFDGETLLSGVIPAYDPEPFYQSAVLDRNGDLVVKLVNVQPTPVAVDVEIAGAPRHGRILIDHIDGYELDARNSLDQPEHVKPRREQDTYSGNAYSLTLPAYSLQVVRFLHD